MPSDTFYRMKDFEFPGNIFFISFCSESAGYVGLCRKLVGITQKQKNMLPKFLLADNSLEAPDTIYVVHNETPRFIVEADIEDFWSNQQIHWIDGEPGDEDLIAELVEAAEEFLEKEFENEERLAEEDDED